MEEYGGLRKGNTVIGVTHIPNRKRPCLFIQVGNTLKPLAYFTDEDSATAFWSCFKDFTGVTDERGQEIQTDCQWR